jgi:hypothetical protein
MGCCALDNQTTILSASNSASTTNAACIAAVVDTKERMRAAAPHRRSWAPRPLEVSATYLLL